MNQKSLHLISRLVFVNGRSGYETTAKNVRAKRLLAATNGVTGTGTRALMAAAVQLLPVRRTDATFTWTQVKPATYRNHNNQPTRSGCDKNDLFLIG